MKCWLSCSIFIIVTLLILGVILALLVAYTVNMARNNFRKNFALATIDYCRSIELVRYTTSVNRPRNPGIYEYRLARALLEASIIVTQSNCFNKIPVDNPPGFTDQERFIIYHPRDNKRRMIATLFTGPGKILIAFTGTFFLNQWATDLNFVLKEAIGLTNYQPGIMVHSGFYNMYMEAQTQIRDSLDRIKSEQEAQGINVDVYITGHSLGGALATLASFDLAEYDPITYTFASPRVGNPAFANAYNRLVPQALRIYNIEDTIVELPLPITFGNVYQHIQSGIPFDINLGNLRDNHIVAYLRYLPICIQNIAPCNN